MHTQK